MPFLTAIILIPLIALLFYAFVMFDRLLRAEYQQHRPVWETDGRPVGFFWRAQESGLLTGHIARARLTFAWLFRTPAWIAGSPALVTMLRRLRFAVLIWNVGVLVWFAIFLTLLHD